MTGVNKESLYSDKIIEKKTFYEWGDINTSEIIILAIHGYNDYANSFKLPAKYLSKNNIVTFSFDLDGFGKNDNSGFWFPLEVHRKLIKKELLKLKKKYPQKKIFLLGESMGGAIITSLMTHNKGLPIDGAVLVAPALWNFSEKNFFKSLFMSLISRLFPNLKVDSKGWVEVKASDNQEVLKELSQDKYFIHHPNLKSLYGIIELMDESYKDAKKFFSQPSYNTLVVIPIKDEIVPRKPLIELLEQTKIKTNSFSSDFIIFESSYHMILRDMKGNNVTKEIKKWILERKTKKKTNFNEVIQKLRKADYHHILD